MSLESIVKNPLSALSIFSMNVGCASLHWCILMMRWFEDPLHSREMSLSSSMNGPSTKTSMHSRSLRPCFILAISSMQRPTPSPNVFSGICLLECSAELNHSFNVVCCSWLSSNHWESLAPVWLRHFYDLLDALRCEGLSCLWTPYRIIEASFAVRIEVTSSEPCSSAESECRLLCQLSISLSS